MAIKDYTSPFRVGDWVEKVNGDYYFEGEVVALFQKRSGAIRLVVENDHGVLHVYNQSQLRHKMIGMDSKINPNVGRDLIDLAIRAVEQGKKETAIAYLKSLSSMVRKDGAKA